MNFDRLTEFLDYTLPFIGVPGSDTVIYKDHEPVYRHQGGYDNMYLATPVRDNALYNIYSCTKVSTCVAAMQLLERGELLLTDPVYAYLPEYRSLKVKRTMPDGSMEIEDAKSPMLIKHLFSMTSGLNYDLNRAAIARVREETDGRCPTLDIARAIAEEPLEFEPGERFRYSLSHDVLGAIVELVSGEKLGDYMRENIFGPLGMKDTTFERGENVISRLATQYQYDAAAHRPVVIGADNAYVFGSEYQSGGAGLISSVDDYVLLVDALANMGVGKSGERILSSAAVDLLRTSVVKDLGPKFGAQHDGYDYAYGVRVCTTPTEAGILVPSGTFGWDGAKLSIASADPKNRIAIFHAEHMGGLHKVVMPRLLNVIYSCIDEV